MKRTVVRCASGGLYSTIWVPMVSLKAVRLGGSRWQRCPVHGKWETARPVDPGQLTAEQRRAAEAITDIGIP
ncbi:hypothetical protein OG579_10615 [Williamsia herbipolensis]|uniref:Uncharacterized protein n=1 Tax=Williamsia herbipolensis TaxID=1603258 RepID=A0AAU4JWP0_9NOCA|nr:hypothetical protein [Williamsia herbipolensis]